MWLWYGEPPFLVSQSTTNIAATVEDCVVPAQVEEPAMDEEDHTHIYSGNEDPRLEIVWTVNEYDVLSGE